MDGSRYAAGDMYHPTVLQYPAQSVPNQQQQQHVAQMPISMAYQPGMVMAGQPQQLVMMSLPQQQQPQPQQQQQHPQHHHSQQQQQMLQQPQHFQAAGQNPTYDPHRQARELVGATMIAMSQQPHMLNQQQPLQGDGTQPRQQQMFHQHPEQQQQQYQHQVGMAHQSSPPVIQVLQPQSQPSKDEQDLEERQKSIAMTLAAMSTPERKMAAQHKPPATTTQQTQEHTLTPMKLLPEVEEQSLSSNPSRPTSVTTTPQSSRRPPSAGGRSPRRKKRKADPALIDVGDQKYEERDCVWAKFEGFAWWPAKIMPRDSPHGDFDGLESTDRDATSHLCHFFGSYDVAWISEAKLRHFKPANATFRKKCRTKLFNKALVEADEFVESGKEPPLFSLSLALKDRTNDTDDDDDNDKDDEDEDDEEEEVELKAEVEVAVAPVTKKKKEVVVSSRKQPKPEKVLTDKEQRKLRVMQYLGLAPPDPTMFGSA